MAFRPQVTLGLAGKRVKSATENPKKQGKNTWGLEHLPFLGFAVHPTKRTPTFQTHPLNLLIHHWRETTHDEEGVPKRKWPRRTEGGFDTR